MRSGSTNLKAKGTNSNEPWNGLTIAMSTKWHTKTKSYMSWVMSLTVLGAGWIKPSLLTWNWMAGWKQPKKRMLSLKDNSCLAESNTKNWKENCKSMSWWHRVWISKALWGLVRYQKSCIRKHTYHLISQLTSFWWTRRKSIRRKLEKLRHFTRI